MLRILLLTCLMLACMGCQLIPDVAHQPVVHNPFPQIHRVAVAPFINLSDEETVDGEQFAEAYFAELQGVPGFEALPPNVVIEEIKRHGLAKLDNPSDARRLAQALGVDAVVVGYVTDFSPYYPPRVGMKVEWYTANSAFHPIPPGYGLPWGTPEEEFIPSPLVFEAEFALARAQLKTQTPPYEPEPPQYMPHENMSPIAPGQSEPLPLPGVGDPKQMESGDSSAANGPSGASESAPKASGQTPPMSGGRSASGASDTVSNRAPVSNRAAADQTSDVELAQYETIPPGMSDETVILPDAMGKENPDLPSDWPNQGAFIPPPPSSKPAKCDSFDGPIMTHARIYRGNDSVVTEALASYVFFRDEGRLGGWQAYLRRSDDFIRFCCHMHIYEMLSARGGGGETRVVWRWLDSR